MCEERVSDRWGSYFCIIVGLGRIFEWLVQRCGLFLLRVSLLMKAIFILIILLSQVSPQSKCSQVSEVLIRLQFPGVFRITDFVGVSVEVNGLFCT